MSGDLAQVTGNLTGNLVSDFNLGSTVSFLNIKQSQPALEKNIVLPWTDGAIGSRFAFGLQFYRPEVLFKSRLKQKLKSRRTEEDRDKHVY